MDVKAPLSKYEAVCGVPVDHRLINESIDLLMHDGVDYEFRTTVLPEFSHSDVLAIARRVRGARRYALQRYRLPRHEDAPEGKPVFTVTHLPDWPEPIMDELQAIVRSVELRGFEIPQTRETAKPKFAMYTRQ
jgi:pyruvate formate lyase activating enzyme